MTQCVGRRYTFIEEWEPGSKVEIIMTGEIGEPQLDAIEAFVKRRRLRLTRAVGEDASGSKGGSDV